MFSYLPNEILFKIIIPLDAKDIFNLCYTNKDLYALSQNDNFWREKWRYNRPNKECKITNLSKFYQNIAFTKLIYISDKRGSISRKRIKENMTIKNILGYLSEECDIITLLDKECKVIMIGCNKDKIHKTKILKDTLLQCSLKFLWNTIHTIKLE
ncbi:F-box domain-containing protein [Orpheovirus IHUMI-LCC2]|uniref:F-box domain-containing protein n=1 Tax=Orpheovirus IHUMI-LCC2 TaxID=2023057 RepID=A0A2I2L447_9VIRU|nr:F-box domain-containing protein [Orpheovirus IHUMI-LCC2]SNW62297.1 F-box domain-containing protein [Orpheovirus IHUMI-LCC2]